jgi:hypothetical protein
MDIYDGLISEDAEEVDLGSIFPVAKIVAALV